ncbi:MAG: TerB family tellurite resistance protein [Candidatus Cloacimonetes bacterium]|nr:TerB family tellurite resistance protein [Candidatus Cloacimonadota bacterium]
MPRWSKYLGNSVNFAVEKTPKEGFLENFFETRTFEPRNEQEQKEYDDFSFISTALSLTVYVSLADEEVTLKEKERIISEMIFQIEQHPYEYACLSEKFGSNDKEIVNSLFEKFKDEILSENFDLDNNIRIINMIYQNNPYKKYFLLRLCYIIGFTDSKDINRELEVINQIAHKLHIPDVERDRIKKEVMKEYKFD